MSVLIKGMEMPTEEEIGKCIIVRHDGEVWVVEFDKLIDGGYVACYPTNPMRVVPVPPHGDLIDRDAICYQLEKQATIDGQPRAIRRARRIVADAPTIIPAEEGE